MGLTPNLVDKLTNAGLSGKYGDRSDPKWVRIWVRDEFKCVYCKEELLKDVIRMSSAQIDHLLPKSKYPEFADSEANFVLCASAVIRLNEILILL